MGRHKKIVEKVIDKKIKPENKKLKVKEHKIKVKEQQIEDKEPKIKIKETKISGHGLAPYEKETIITFNREDKEADIFTYEPSWQNHLEKRFKIVAYSDNGSGGKFYKIDKTRIKLPKAPTHRKKKADKVK